MRYQSGHLSAAAAKSAIITQIGMPALLPTPRVINRGPLPLHPYVLGLRGAGSVSSTGCERAGLRGEGLTT